MLQNNFTNSPTVGSSNYRTMDELWSRVQTLEQRVEHLEQKLQIEDHQRNNERQYCDEQRPKKIKWGKIRKFFNSVIKPILSFIPNYIMAVASLNKTKNEKSFA